MEKNAQSFKGKLCRDQIHLLIRVGFGGHHRSTSNQDFSIAVGIFMKQ